MVDNYLIFTDNHFQIVNNHLKILDDMLINNFVMII